MPEPNRFHLGEKAVDLLLGKRLGQRADLSPDLLCGERKAITAYVHPLGCERSGSVLGDVQSNTNGGVKASEPKESVNFTGQLWLWCRPE